MPPKPESNDILWSAKPSIALIAPHLIVCLLFFWLVFPLLWLGWRYLELKNTSYDITAERICVRTGVLNKRKDWLELYRVKDIFVLQPLALRPFRKGCITLITSDRTHATFEIQAIENAEAISELLRNFVEQMRTAKGVREFD